MINVSCSCGNTKEVADSFAGGVCKCDACGAVLTVPDEPIEATPAPSPAVAAPPARPDRPERPDTPPAPPRQRPDRPPAPPSRAARSAAPDSAAMPVVPGRQPGTQAVAAGDRSNTTTRARKRARPTALYAFAAIVVCFVLFLGGVLFVAFQMSGREPENPAALAIDNEPDAAVANRPTITAPRPRNDDAADPKPTPRPADPVTPAGPAKLFAHWPLDGDYNDRGPHGLHGKPRGDPTFTSGAVGQAVDFDGDDRVEIDYHPALDTLLDGVSICVWVKLPPDTKQQMWTGIVNQGDSSWRISLIMDNPGQLHFAINRGQNKDRIDSKRKDYNDGKWHHVVGIYARDECRLYIDGEHIATNRNPAKSIKKTKLPVWIGDNSEKKWALIGAIDDVRLYEGALTEAEVKQLYEQGR